MLIRNFGHLWERKYINFGRPVGHLRGSHNRLEADFRQQIGIYLLSDKDLLPVYVGQTGMGNSRLLARLKQHSTDHLRNRWAHFSWFGFRGVNKTGALSAVDTATKVFKVKGGELLNEIEGALITALEPKLNKQGAKWKTVVHEYRQVVDDTMNDATLSDILNGHEEIKEQIRRLSKVIQRKQ